MSGYMSYQATFLIDPATNNAVGVLDALGLEWAFPVSDITVVGDYGDLQVEATLISSTDGLNTPVGFNAQGRDFTFAASFTPNTQRGLRAERRNVMVNSGTGVPAGVFGGSANEFATLPLAQN